MPLYEHVFLARQDVSQAQVEALTKEYTDLIEAAQGKVTKTEYWGLKSLTFKVKKNRRAHYTLLNIDAPSAAVTEMERLMGLSTDVIRFITVKVEAHETEPSVQMRKGDREDRGERGDRGDRGGGFRGERGGFRGDRPPREGGGFRGDRADRPPREGGGFRSDRGDRPPREGGPRPPREGGDAPRTPRTPTPEAS